MLAEEPAPAKAVFDLGFQMENVMSEGSGRNGEGNTALAVILGALIVVVAALGFLMFHSHGFGHFDWAHWHR